VNWSRSIFSHVPSTKVREIAAMLKAIHVGEDIAAAQQKKAVRVIEKAARSAADHSRELVRDAAALSPSSTGGAFAPRMRWTSSFL